MPRKTTARPNRKALTKKTRFEVFKRDKFICQYCGRTATEVVLEVDHIVPVASGGGNDVMNLVTACRDCNAGKLHRELSDDSVIAKQHRQLAELQERREQLEMMIAWRTELESADTEVLTHLIAHIEKAGECYQLNELGRKDVRSWLRTYSYDELITATNIAAEKLLHDSTGLVYNSSWNEYFSLIPRIAKMRRVQVEKPYMKDALYIRGILRNRFRIWKEDQSLALDLIIEAIEKGADIEALMRQAKRTPSFNEWYDAVSAGIDSANHANS
jgi:hypothetical protein